MGPGHRHPLGDPLTGHTGAVECITAVTLPDGRVLLATGSLDATVRLWDPATATPVGDPVTALGRRRASSWALAVSSCWAAADLDSEA